MPIKLKVLSKSHYSHEIRKDVNISDLKSLKLEDAWPFIREEIEKEIGSDEFVCIPHVTEADLYNATSVFVQNAKETNGKLYKPLGELKDIIDREKSDPEYVAWLDAADHVDSTFKFPHESVKITLQDEAVKNKVRVIMVNFTRALVPRDKDLVGKIYVDKTKIDGKKSFYMITNVLLVNTLEFRVTMKTCSRIFHLGNPTPLVFGFDEIIVDAEGQVIDRKPVQMKSNSLQWNRVSHSDSLYLKNKNTALCV